MKIQAKKHPLFYKWYNQWIHSNEPYFDSFLKENYNLSISTGDNLYWEDEYFFFNSEEDYFLSLLF